ncbi:all trans-polyprenyl-diphosphate synthase PDSS2-like [Oscarella lobularis]|uniref:all trans-polyprenyl-diphosphate synthase PDSS2-like n=1 Tax=Oscarella lobularis TaxID=121494 RepID=UPI003313214C
MFSSRIFPRISLVRASSMWRHVLSEAEKTVGHPTSYLGLRYLLSDEMSNVMRNFRRLAGTRHPLLKKLGGFLLNEPNNIHVRGLVVLLISKATQSLLSSHRAPLEPRDATGILPSQRKLAEITELIHMGYLMHDTTLTPNDENESNDLIYGNKMAILAGDFLLANASLELAKLHNTKVVELISEAIADISEGVFIEIEPSEPIFPDRFPWLVPSALSVDLNQMVHRWLHHTYLQTGSLLGKSCQAAMLLSSNDSDVMAHAYGQHLAIANQIHEDMIPFRANAYGSLRSGNVVIAQTGINDKVTDFSTIEDKHFNVLKNLAQYHSEKAAAALGEFPPSEAKETLLKIAQTIAN